MKNVFEFRLYLYVKNWSSEVGITSRGPYFIKNELALKVLNSNGLSFINAAVFLLHLFTDFVELFVAEFYILCRN